MNFVIDSGPHIKDKDNTSRIMRAVTIALIPIVFFAFYKNGLLPYQKGYISLWDAFRPLVIIILSMVTSFASELLYARFVLGRKKEELSSYMKHSYSLLPGLFLALVIPINTPLWLVSIGSIFASVVGKMFFGGFGHNIFNPALLGSLFITASYGSLIAKRGGYLNGLELDTISSSTPLTNLSHLGHMGSFHQAGSSFGSLWDYFFGFIPGAIGETSKILILVAMVYLILNKVIKWRIPITYLATVFIMTLIIGQISNEGLWYPTFNLLSGGLMFGAVFMATDPVTSPVTRSGQFLYGLCLGLLTVIFRYLTPYPEGVLTAILTMNMLVFTIDKLGVRIKFNPYKLFVPAIILIVLAIGLSIYIGFDIKPKETTPTDGVNIINVKKEGNMTIYTATTKGFHGDIKADVTIYNNAISDITIIDQQETYWQNIVDKNYLDKLIEGQNDISKVDTVSGATISSGALKIMIKDILDDYKKSR